VPRNLQNPLARIQIEPVVLVPDVGFHIDPEGLVSANLFDHRERTRERLRAQAAGETAGFAIEGRQPFGRFDTATAGGVEEDLVVRRFECE
jgi:hypothetical protein